MPGSDWIGRGRVGRVGRAGWGEAWNRRAPVKVPPERSPPPLLASLPGLLEVARAHVTFYPPRTSPCSEPQKEMTLGVSRVDGETVLLALQVPKDPGRNFSWQSYSKGTWVGRVCRTPFSYFGGGRFSRLLWTLVFLLAETKIFRPIHSPDRLP